MGVCFYYMLTGRAPFEGQTKPQLLENIRKSSGINLNFGNVEISDGIKLLIKSMLQIDLTNRIKFPDIFKFFGINDNNVDTPVSINNQPNVQQNVGQIQNLQYDFFNNFYLVYVDLQFNAI